MTMTKKNSIPIKLWIETNNNDDMKQLSNKRQQLLELFDWLDFRKLGRVDTLEICAIIIMSVVGSHDTLVQSKSPFANTG
jgi:hypothetical protein